MKPWLTIRTDGPTMYISDHTGRALQTSDVEKPFGDFIQGIPRTVTPLGPFVEDDALRVYFLGEWTDPYSGDNKPEWRLQHKGEHTRFAGLTDDPKHGSQEFRHCGEIAQLDHLIIMRLYPDWQPSLTLPYQP